MLQTICVKFTSNAKIPDAKADPIQTTTTTAISEPSAVLLPLVADAVAVFVFVIVVVIVGKSN